MYKNRYRIESAHLKDWDYSSSGHYYMTICTKDRISLFGNIDNWKMQISGIGEIVLSEWNESFNIRSELNCDCYIIMPNHIHAIIVIDNTVVGTYGPVETHVRASLQQSVAFRMPKSISSFVAGFKSGATKQINHSRNTPGTPVWQPLFYEHIIRNENDLNRIRQYVINNPMNWDKDDFHP